MDQQFSFDETDRAVLVREEFNCCSRFRECSNAMKCLCPDGIDYANCLYRQKLESGICYYGKNAPDFDMSAYQSFCEKILSLEQESKTLFDNFIKKYVRTRRDYLVRDEASLLYEKLDSLGLLSLNYNAKRTLSHMKSTELRAVIKKFRSSAQRKEDGLRLNQANVVLIDYIMNKCPDYTAKLAKKFAYLSLHRELYQYYWEYYYDYLLK